MGFAKLIIIFILSYYTIYVFKLLVQKKERQKIVDKNKVLDKIRKQPIKTLEEQKNFLDIKYPQSKFKWEWKLIPKILIQVALYFSLYKVFNYLITLSGWEPTIWQGILAMIVFPLIINYILSLFKIELDKDLQTLIKWR